MDLKLAQEAELSLDARWRLHMIDLLSWLTTDGGLPEQMMEGLSHPRFWVMSADHALVSGKLTEAPRGRLSTSFHGTWESPIVANYSRRDRGVTSRWKGKIPRVVVESSKRIHGLK